MESEALKYVAVGLMAFGMAGAAIGVSNVFKALLEGIARNPEAESKMSVYAFVGAGMAEAMGIFALIVALMVLYA